MAGDRGELTFKELRDIVGPIAASYGMKRVYLFGSRARGDFDEDSDYDFCVITGDDCTLFTLSGFLIRLKEALGTEVDVVCEDALTDDFADTIVNDRRIVYEA